VPGYEAFLIDEGYEPFEARLMGHAVNSDQWVPRGEVLRCIADDGGPDGELTIHIDNEELSLAEFGKLLRYYAGWGMRIAFVPEERVTENPMIVVRARRRGDDVELLRPVLPLK
jgi:hypothetical protein